MQNNLKIAAYDTGFGFAVCPDVGHEVPGFALERLLTVRLPDRKDFVSFEEWEKAFKAQKTLLTDMVNAYNKRSSL